MSAWLRFIDRGSPYYPGELKLRFEVLRKPLGMPEGSERFAHEDDCIHLVAIECGGERGGEPGAEGGRSAGSVVGCVLFHPHGDRTGRLLQMAVEPALRGRGVGRLLVRALEERVHALGHHEVVLHARDHAIGFYERLGYVCFGEPYEEVGIPHRNMRRRLP